MYIAGGLVETYALEMLKYAKNQRMTKQNLMNAKVIVTLVYKIGENLLEKNITGKNQTIINGLKIIDKHTSEMNNRVVYIKEIKLDY
ncbi:hypothetical protein [Staphylococcus phage SpP]